VVCAVQGGVCMWTLWAVVSCRCFVFQVAVNHQSAASSLPPFVVLSFRYPILTRAYMYTYV
jgi:hypothetical protein